MTTIEHRFCTLDDPISTNSSVPLANYPSGAMVMLTSGNVPTLNPSSATSIYLTMTDVNDTFFLNPLYGKGKQDLVIHNGQYGFASFYHPTGIELNVGQGSSWARFANVVFNGKRLTIGNSLVSGAEWQITSRARFETTPVLTMTTSPTVSADIGAGYSTGDIWVNTVAKEIFLCLTNTLGAALWANFNTGLNTVKPFLATTSPTISSDITAGFQVGQIWINTTTRVPFVCVRNSTGAAYWRSINSGLLAIDIL